jgi:hypothetical protein
MGRDTVGQGQKGMQPRFLGLTKQLHIRPAIRSANDRLGRDHQNIRQFMPLGSVNPWGFDFGMVLGNLLNLGFLGHDLHLLPISEVHYPSSRNLDAFALSSHKRQGIIH